MDISERPAAVEEKSRTGDWEVDTIVGAQHRGALVTAVERSTKVVCIQHVERKTKAAVSAALVAMLKPFADVVLTITADNGSEFAGHAEVTAALGAAFYFATPYHSWERGLNENTNGRIRRFFGKGEDLRQVDPAKVEYVETRLNHCPRKALGFRTPAQALAEARGRPPPGDPLAPRGP